MKRVLILSIVLFGLLIPSYCVDAKTLQDLYNELGGIQKAYNNSQRKANMTQAELKKVKANISSLENEIKKSQNQIIQAEKDIIASEKKIAQKKEETNQMLKYLQVANTKGNSMLEYIFDADDYTELIYRYSVVTQMSDANKKLMDELNVLIKELEVKKVTLAKEQKKLTANKIKLQGQYALLQGQYAELQEDNLSLSGQISEIKKQIAAYERKGCKRNQNLNSCGGAPAVSGWTYPISSFRQSSNYGWDENRYHYAVDLGVGEGTPVRAVAEGTVLVSRVYWKENLEGVESCGGNVVQIVHNYKGTDYVSLYMHLVSRSVSVGDTVSRGQVIGYSGGGEDEVAAVHDTCTGGPHLHFAMSYGANTIGKSSLLGNTFDPVKFFPAMRGIGSVL